MTVGVTKHVWGCSFWGNPRRLTWACIVARQQAGGHGALALAEGCLQQGDQALGMQTAPELSGFVQDVVVVCIMVGGGCFRKGRQAVGGSCWQWHLTTVYDDCCHILSNHLCKQACVLHYTAVCCCYNGRMRAYELEPLPSLNRVQLKK